MLNATRLQSEDESPAWPVERKISLVLEEWFDHQPAVEICRRAGVSLKRYHQWRDRFIDAGRAGLACSKAEYCTLNERIRHLEAENVNLQRQVRTLQELCTAD